MNRYKNSNMVKFAKYLLYVLFLLVLKAILCGRYYRSSFTNKEIKPYRGLLIYLFP